MCALINQRFILEETHKDMGDAVCVCVCVCVCEGGKAKANVTHSLWWHSDPKLCSMVSQLLASTALYILCVCVYIQCVFIEERRGLTDQTSPVHKEWMKCFEQTKTFRSLWQINASRKCQKIWNKEEVAASTLCRDKSGEDVLPPLHQKRAVSAAETPEWTSSGCSSTTGFTLTCLHHQPPSSASIFSLHQQPPSAASIISLHQLSLHHQPPSAESPSSASIISLHQLSLHHQPPSAESPSSASIISLHQLSLHRFKHLSVFYGLRSELFLGWGRRSRPGNSRSGR